MSVLKGSRPVSPLARVRRHSSGGFRADSLGQPARERGLAIPPRSISIRLRSSLCLKENASIKSRITVITLGVDDLEWAVRFYRDGLGLKTEGIIGKGATLIKPAQDTFWGGYAGYFQDLDKHLWEVVWNPQLLRQDEA